MGILPLVNYSAPRQGEETQETSDPKICRFQFQFATSQVRFDLFDVAPRGPSQPRLGQQTLERRTLKLASVSPQTAWFLRSTEMAVVAKQSFLSGFTYNITVRFPGILP